MDRVQPPQHTSINDYSPGHAPVYVLDRDQVRSIDQEAIERFGIPGIVLMENAAIAAASEIMRLLGDRPEPTEQSCEGHAALILCGVGNNGGDGYAVARHLHNAGVNVRLLPLAAPRPESDAAINAEICRRMAIGTINLEDLASNASSADVLVDGLFGTGLDRDVTGEPAHLIAAVNALAAERGVPIVALDTPSGLDCQSGRVLGEAIEARLTVTFVGLKPGFLIPAAWTYTGQIVIAPIGAPRELVEQMGAAVGELPDGMPRPRMYLL